MIYFFRVPYTHDNAGRVDLVQRDGSSARTYRAYDPMGRLVMTADGDEGVWRGRYDAWGRLYQEELPTGVIIEPEYDHPRARERRWLWPGQIVIYSFFTWT